MVAKDAKKPGNKPGGGYIKPKPRSKKKKPAAAGDAAVEPAPAKPTETAEERKERKRKAKEERAVKALPVLDDGGERVCKICARTLAVASFSAQQLRKPKSACVACAFAKASEGKDHTPSSKSLKEKRAALKALREKRKRKEVEEPEKKRAKAANDKKEEEEEEEEALRVQPKAANEEEEEEEEAAAAKKLKREDAAAAATTTTADDGFVAAERYDPNAASDSGGDDGDDAAAEEKVKEEEDVSDEEKELRARQVYVGGVPFYKTEDEIRAAFDDEGLPTEAIDCMTFPDSGRFRGIAIITFATREAAKGALAWNGEMWDEKFLTVKKYAPKNAPPKDVPDPSAPPAEPRPEVEKTEGQLVAFIANLAWDTTEETLKNALVGCEIKEIRMGTDKETGAFKGFAHAEFVGDDDLENAVALSGTTLCGREMKITYATKRKKSWEEREKEREANGGGRGGRGRDGSTRGKNGRRVGGRRGPPKKRDKLAGPRKA